jgi:PAS domain S-box-containing protein
MKDKQTSGSWRTAWECILASLALAVLTFVSFRLHAGPAMAALLFFLLVVLISLWAGFLSTAFACAVAALCFVYFFTQPLYHLWMSAPVDIAATIAFSSTALIISRALSRVRERTAELQQTNEQLQAEITERKRAEEKTRQSEAELRQLIDAIPQHVVVLEPDGSFLYLNQVALEYSGLTLEDSLAKDFLTKIFHPDDLERVVGERQQAISRGVPWDAEVRIRGKDGDYRWFIIRLNPLRDEQGRILRWYGTSTDIEDRKRAEETLRREADLLNLTHDAIFVADMEGVIKYWNRAAEERYGWTAEQAVGRVVHDLLKTVFPAPLEQIKAELTRTGRWEGELVHTRKDGSQVVVASRWSLQRGERGAPVAILETNNDITERKRAEEALRRLNRELRAMSNCNQILLRATDEQSLLGEICRIVCEEGGYRMAWVAYAEHDAAKSVRPAAWTGAEEGYLANLGITWADTERGWSPTGTAIRSGKTCCIQDFATDPRLAPWRESALQRGFLSGIALPLKDEHASAFGSLSIYSAQPNAFTSEETRLLEELAADLAFGIVTLRSRAARERAEQALRQSEANLAESQRLTHTGSWALDVAGDKYAYCSEECLRIYGFDPQEGLPTREAVFRRVLPEDLDRVTREFEKPLREKVDSSGELRIVLPDGTVKDIHVIRHPVLNSVGDVVKLVGTSIDITERKRVEEALSESERKYRELVEHANSIILRWTHDGRITFLNEFGLKFFGYSAEEIIGRQVVGTIVPPTERGGRDLRQLMLQVCAAPRAFEQNINENMRRNGERVTIAWTNKIVWGTQGEVAEILSVGTDITERRRAEEALRQSEAYLAESQRLTHTGSWAWDLASDQYVYVSEECLRIFGFDLQQGVPTGEAVLRQIHPEDRNRWKENFEKSLHEKVDTFDEYRIVLPDGTVKHIHTIRHPVLNGAGDVVKLVGTSMDITERKRAEEALRQSEAYLAESQRLTHTGSWAFDLASNKYIYASEECFRIFELDAQERFPNREVISRHMHPEDWDRVNESFEKSLRERVDTSTEFRIVLPSGTVKHILAIRHPVLNDAGDIVKLVGTAIDMTEHKRAEEERERLHQLEADLARINRVSMMGELAASIAHEVNQPLSGVVVNGNACLRWLAGDAPNLEEAREAVRRIVRDGKRAGDVIARIRALATKTAAAKERLDMNEAIREVVAFAQDEVRRNNVILRVELADALSPVLGDRVQLQQVVLNLVTNGIEAMSSVEERPRELIVRTQNDDAGQVRVTVQDSGIGLDPQSMERMFDAFYTTKHGGMGLGLSISRSIIQHHGGKLWAVANDGPGMSVQFTIPKYQQ